MVVPLRRKEGFPSPPKSKPIQTFCLDGHGTDLVSFASALYLFPSHGNGEMAIDDGIR